MTQKFTKNISYMITPFDDGTSEAKYESTTFKSQSKSSHFSPCPSSNPAKIGFESGDSNSGLEYYNTVGFDSPF